MIRLTEGCSLDESCIGKHIIIVYLRSKGDKENYDSVWDLFCTSLQGNSDIIKILKWFCRGRGPTSFVVCMYPLNGNVYSTHTHTRWEKESLVPFIDLFILLNFFPCISLFLNNVLVLTVFQLRQEEYMYPLMGNM